MTINKQRARFLKRKQRVRFTLKRKAKGRPRLSVFRSNHHIYAQIIDDQLGRTLAAASSLEADLRSESTGDCVSAQAVGKRLAERAQLAGVNQVVFDRSGFRYHGRVRALAEAARNEGIDF